MKKNGTLWVVQALLAAAFLLAGVPKLYMPAEQMIAPGPIQYPTLFVRFIGVCEILGAIGLIVPAATGIMPSLTRLAAWGLVVIMIGATVTNLANMPAFAILTGVLGVLAAWVAHTRRADAKMSSASRA